MIFVAQAVKQTGSPDEEVSDIQWFDLDKLPPAEMMAFDHGEDIDLYLKYLKENFVLPKLG